MNNRLTYLLLGLAACGAESEPVAFDAEGIFASLGEVMPRATEEQRATFERGRKVAERRFSPEQGLGPTFNVTTCASCHEKPVLGGAGGHYRDFLLVGNRQPDGSFVPLGKNGVQDQYSLTDPVRQPSPEDENHSATRNPIAFFGVGALASIDEAAILENADPDDADGDGISGRPNYDRGFVGRFGMKCQTVSIEKFIRGPLMNHLGVTTNPLSDELKRKLPVPSAADSGDAVLRSTMALSRLTQAQVAAPDGPTVDMDGVADPELSEQDLFDLVSFSMLLAAPKAEPLNETTEAGSERFSELGCAACHVRALEGPDGLVPAYTDLLLHDMGPELEDGIIMAESTGAEFRTAPLWGVIAVAPYLHDGRAATLEEAILAHGGEAERSRKAYRDLAQAERDQVLAFLESLGGREQTSAGLLPPGAPLPKPTELGGPLASLDAERLESFEAGRLLFDRDVGVSAGLGPTFNGDSCRACHFLGALGGAGPADVDVTRQGLLDDLGRFNPPDMGTMAHRHGNDGKRPAIDPAASLFELRQTPALFGLGLVEQIAQADLIARADPDDLDGDGISGRAHVLSDGSLGRFGWKANVPTLADFARDALTNELGLTLPESDSSFGRTKDEDAHADPEIDEQSIADLTLFMRSLAPPPRAERDAQREGRGSALFEQVGCTSCHVPEHRTEAGDKVRAFSDFLLHDVAPSGYVGVGDGDADGRELRTPPLWGLSVGAPYLHDASESSVEGAIAAHAGEGSASRTAYEALSASAREDLLAFLQSL